MTCVLWKGLLLNGLNPVYESFCGVMVVFVMKNPHVQWKWFFLVNTNSLGEKTSKNLNIKLFAFQLAFQTLYWHTYCNFFLCKQCTVTITGCITDRRSLAKVMQFKKSLANCCCTHTDIFTSLFALLHFFSSLGGCVQTRLDWHVSDASNTFVGPVTGRRAYYFYHSCWFMKFGERV